MTTHSVILMLRGYLMSNAVFTELESCA